MNLAEIKTSDIPKRKLFQIERAIIREAVNLWFQEKAYFNTNFSEEVEVEFKGKRIEVSFSNRGKMQHGAPEATVNDLMRGLLLTMVTDQATGKLVKNYEGIIGNIIDVFVHRLKEFGERRFIFQRLQSLELGFDVAFGLSREFYPIKKARRYLEEALTVASLSTADETAETLINNMLETETLGAKEHGVTFHIFMARDDKASFISLPLGVEQTTYVSLLGTHTLRCNILADLESQANIKRGILKIDAPSDPLNFIRHKGIDLDIEENELMDKLRSVEKLTVERFSEDEMVFLRLLFNEYVSLAHYLLSSGCIDPGLRLLVIFPRINIYALLHGENSAIPPDEPQTLGELAALYGNVFKIRQPPGRKKKKKSSRISERVIQEKVFETISALARHTLRNIYKPLSDIKRNLHYYTRQDYEKQELLDTVKQRVDAISAYLKKFNAFKRVVLVPGTQDIDVDASMQEIPRDGKLVAQDEIIRNIQAAEIEQVKDVIVSKMLGYLSFITHRLEQLNKVSSPYIKQEVVAEMEAYTATIMLQARSFYKLVRASER